MPSRAELVAHERTEAEITAHIGADLVIFQTLPDLLASCTQFNPSITEFDCSVFTGKYVTGGVDEAYLAGLESARSDNAKLKAARNGTAAAIASAEENDASISCSGPMNGADDNISQVVGLNNAHNASDHIEHPDVSMGLSNLGRE